MVHGGWMVHSEWTVHGGWMVHSESWCVVSIDDAQ